MRLKRLGVIGTGAISSLLIQILSEKLLEPLDSITLLASERSRENAFLIMQQYQGKIAKKIHIVDNLLDFLIHKPQFVTECAGHSAVFDHVESLLKMGIETAIVSTGALSNMDLKKRLIKAANIGKTRLIVSSGALGGVDILSAGWLSTLETVEYTSRKPPKAWRGTKAEQLIDLDTITEETIFFTGDAEDAARDYPKNANVAATAALAGFGMNKTRVRLIADPNSTSNVHEMRIISNIADVEIKITGKPHPDNPKTSITTAYSLAREVMMRVLPIVA